MSIHTIIYTSKATNDLAGEAIAEIEAILATARRRNADCGIRGALLFTEGRFVQALEGDKDIVERTFERISSDPRHHDIEVLCRQSASKPRFEYWSMAFVGETTTLRHRYADAPLADVANEVRGDALLDFMRDIARSAD